MKTFAELKTFCEKNNVRFELNKKYAKDEIFNFTTGEFEKVRDEQHCGSQGPFGMELDVV